MKYLIEDVLTITVDKEQRVLNHGYIGIDQGKILFVEEGRGPQSKAFHPDRTLAGKGKIALPGLVNAHTHTPMTLLRGWGSDLSLQDWLFKKILPVEETLSDSDLYWGGMLGMVEQIRSGISCFADMYLGMDSMARVVHESGLRANLAGPFVAGESVSAYGDKLQAFNNQNPDFLKGYAIIHAIYTTPEEKICDIAQMAKSIGTGIHIHVSETQHEVESTQAQYGGSTPVEMLAQWGVFDVPTLAAHCVHVNDRDIAIFQEKGVGVAHCPSSNLKLGSGIAPIPSLLDAGLSVGIGTDGAASNNNLNMIEEMHLAGLIHKGFHQNPLLVKAQEVVTMATQYGADALGFGDLVGSIEAGKCADIVLLDSAVPHVTPLHDPMATIAYTIQGSDVDTLMVGGKLLMEHKELTTIDEERVLFEVNRIGDRLRSSSY